MLKGLVYVCIVAGGTLSASLPSVAQEVIHALTGTVGAIDSTAKTITVLQDNGSKNVFKVLEDSRTRIAFDKKVASETTAANGFDKPGAYAIIFYFGGSGDQTVVALKSLGKGPFESTVGTVTKFDSHVRSISVADGQGKVSTFKVAPETVAEGNFGVVDAARLQVQKGDHVRVVSSTVDGEDTALFIRDI